MASRKKRVQVRSKKKDPKFRSNLPEYKVCYTARDGKIQERLDVILRFCEKEDQELIAKALVVMFGFSPDLDVSVRMKPLFQFDQVRSYAAYSLLRLMVGHGYIRPAYQFRNRGKWAGNQEKYQTYLALLKEKRALGILSEGAYSRQRAALKKRFARALCVPVQRQFSSQKYQITRKGVAEIRDYVRKYGHANPAVAGMVFEPLAM